MQHRTFQNSLRKLSLVATISLLVTTLVLYLRRKLSARGLESHSQGSCQSYDEAIARFALVQTRDDPTVNPVCHSRLLSHGHQTEQAIVLIHGLTNCPQQYAKLAPLFFDQGYNVLILRLPRHGLADRRTSALGQLSAAELRDYTDTAVDIACGLGEQVAVFGISAGAIMAAWAGQFRTEVDRIILVAPAFGVLHYNSPMHEIIIALCILLPDSISRFLGRFKDAPPHCYQSHSTHALGEIMRLGQAVMNAASHNKPYAASVAVITNAADNRVNNAITEKLIKLWQADGVKQLVTYEFEAQEGLDHDIIEPELKAQRNDLVYPILMEYAVGTRE